MQSHSGAVSVRATCGMRGGKGQRAPCEEQSDGSSAAGVGLTDFCLLAIEKHITSTPQTSALQNRMLFPSNAWKPS